MIEFSKMWFVRWRVRWRLWRLYRGDVFLAVWRCRRVCSTSGVGIQKRASYGNEEVFSGFSSKQVWGWGMLCILRWPVLVLCSFAYGSLIILFGSWSVFCFPAVCVFSSVVFHLCVVCLVCFWRFEVSVFIWALCNSVCYLAAGFCVLLAHTRQVNKICSF